jgi:thiol-disulfide isomerase/thioredoxin
LTRTREWSLVAAIALAAAAAGVAYYLWHTSGAAREDRVAALTRTRFVDLEGHPRSIAEWQGRVVVVNFWATWCAPCREEIPLFVKLQQRYGVNGLQFVGIAIDEPKKVRPYANELGMNFPILIGGADAIDLTRELGNRAAVLPFTLVLDRTGRVTSMHIGVEKEGELVALIQSLL